MQKRIIECMNGGSHPRPTNLSDDRGSGILGSGSIGVFYKDWESIAPKRYNSPYYSSYYPSYYPYGNPYYSPPSYPYYPRSYPYYSRRSYPYYQRRPWYNFW